MLLSAVVARAEQGAEGGPLLISSSSEVHGSVLSDTIVQRNCTLHVRGNLLGSLTIEPGANVIVEGSVDGKINNKGGSSSTIRDLPPALRSRALPKRKLAAS